MEEIKNIVLWSGVLCVFIAAYGFVNMILIPCSECEWWKFISFGMLGFVVMATLYHKIKDL